MIHERDSSFRLRAFLSRKQKKSSRLRGGGLGNERVGACVGENAVIRVQIAEIWANCVENCSRCPFRRCTQRVRHWPGRYDRNNKRQVGKTVVRSCATYWMRWSLISRCLRRTSSDAASPTKRHRSALSNNNQ